MVYGVCMGLVFSATPKKTVPQLEVRIREDLGRQLQFVPSGPKTWTRSDDEGVPHLPVRKFRPVRP